MKIMQQKHFWIYSGFGAMGFVSSMLILAMVNASMEEPDPHPDYVAFQKQVKEFRREHPEQTGFYQQRYFEEALLGRRKIEEIPNAELQAVAKAVVALKPKGAAEVMAQTHKLFLVQEEGKRVGPWSERYYLHSEYHWRFINALSSLSDDQRLTSLLKGEPDHVFAALPEIPASMPQEPVYPENAPKTTPSSTPNGVSFITCWTVVSMCFALGFCVAGLVGFHSPGTYVEEAKFQAMRKDGKKPEPMSHPTGMYPDFIMGWLIEVAFLPGFLVAHVLHAMLIDFRPYVNAVRARIWPQEFANAYAKLEAQLTVVKTKAEQSGRTSLLAGVEEMLAKVREANDRSQLAKLARTVEQISFLMTAQDELDHDFTAA